MKFAYKLEGQDTAEILTTEDLICLCGDLGITAVLAPILRAAVPVTACNAAVLRQYIERIERGEIPSGSGREFIMGALVAHYTSRGYPIKIFPRSE